MHDFVFLNVHGMYLIRVSEIINMIVDGSADEKENVATGPVLK